VASIFLTMEVCVCDIPEEKSSCNSGAGAHHGMEGMM
jgi:hypothetical protein